MFESFAESSRKTRARKEGKALLREAKRALGRSVDRVSQGIRTETSDMAERLQTALTQKDHDGVCRGLGEVEHQLDQHFSFARKSAFREYAESIGGAILVAAMLRAFVVEAFKIPSGSMIPTMQVGDHIFVNKFIYGLRIPFTAIRFFEYRKPHRGEVIVFIYPVDPDKDFIKRIVAVEGDTVEVRDNQVIVNGEPVDRHPVPGLCRYDDYDDSRDVWTTNKPCALYEENVPGERYTPNAAPHAPAHDFPEEDGKPYVVPKDSVFVMGDNRNNSHDSRFWGPVPLANIKGKALVIWWSQGGPAGIRWSRLFKLVD